MNQGSGAGEDLSPREREVLSLLADGLDARGIARHLRVSLGTVRTHLSRILAKLAVHTQAQAVVWAYKSHLVEAPVALLAAVPGQVDSLLAAITSPHARE
jgi:DNA-binding NarL/FixJ family response regulator